MRYAILSLFVFVLSSCNMVSRENGSIIPHPVPFVQSGVSWNQSIVTRIYWSCNPGLGSWCNQPYCSESISIGTNEVIYSRISCTPELFPTQILTGTIDTNDWSDLVSQFEPGMFTWILQTPLPPDYANQNLLIYRGEKLESYTFDLETHQTGKGKIYFEKLQNIEKSLEKSNPSRNK